MAWPSPVKHARGFRTPSGLPCCTSSWCRSNDATRSGNFEGSLGAVCRYLGLLAQTLGRLDQAEHHLRTAIALNQRMGARPWVAHSRFNLARVLSQRDGPGDRELAVSELSLAQDICRELGMPALEEKAAKLRGDRPANGAREPSGQGRRIFRKEGEYWTVVFGTDAFRLKDIKGLTYLAQLLGHPGREFHVLDLATVAHGVVPRGAAPTPPAKTICTRTTWLARGPRWTNELRRRTGNAFLTWKTSSTRRWLGQTRSGRAGSKKRGVS